MTKKKKVILLSCMIALLAVTAVFNFVLSTDGTVIDTSATSYTDYFTQYRTERASSRNEEIVQLDAVLASTNSTQTEYNSALNMKLALAQMTEKELLLENLIKAYGFEDVVVVIGLESNNVNVITKCANLTSDDAVKIYNVISEENIASPENVKIIPIS